MCRALCCCLPRRSKLLVGHILVIAKGHPARFHTYKVPNGSIPKPQKLDDSYGHSFRLRSGFCNNRSAASVGEHSLIVEVTSADELDACAVVVDAPSAEPTCVNSATAVCRLRTLHAGVVSFVCFTEGHCSWYCAYLLPRRWCAGV